MCGIGGIISSKRADDESLRHRLRGLTDSQAHRGPDDRGEWGADLPNGSVVFSHLRLSIIDLSPLGHQPMMSPCGRYALTFNGEIYNYIELREELIRDHGRTFVSESDTEVVLQAYMVWGSECFNRFNGMWALALADLPRNAVVLSRDRFGEKPLYYAWSGDGFVFASEIKGLLVAANRRFKLNLTVIRRYLEQFTLNAQDETFFEGVHSFPVGHYAVVPLGDLKTTAIEPRSYWQLGGRQLAEHEFRDLPEMVWGLVEDSVRIRMRSDVPVGVLLSGGLDSSVLAAAAQTVLDGAGSLNLISAVSDDERFSERPFIETVVKHVRGQLHTVNIDNVGPHNIAYLERAVYHSDQPVGSFSAVAHMRLMEYCRSIGVTVVLSGQGADEIACGYRKYAAFYLLDLCRRGRILEAMDFLLGAILSRTSLTQFDIADAKRYLSSSPRGTGGGILGPTLQGIDSQLELGLGRGTIRDRQIRDLYCLSVPALTHYEDRMSMAFAREIRLPYLDHRLVEFMVNLPADLLLRDGWSKWALRSTLSARLPSSIVWRRDKQGFLNPERKWLATGLRHGLEGFLGGELLVARHGLINPDSLQAKIKKFCETPTGHFLISEKEILHPIALELWLRRFGSFIEFPN